MIRRIGTVATVLACSCSCSGDADRTVTLVSRQVVQTELVTVCYSEGSSRCSAQIGGRTYRTADGATVVGGGSSATFDLEAGDVAEVTCGAEVFVRAFTGVASDFEVGEAEVLTFDDGSVVRLVPERATAILDECGEQVGSWEGVAGRYEGRRGSYRLVEDRLQATLTLDES